jgi:hypothetical protein
METAKEFAALSNYQVEAPSSTARGNIDSRYLGGICQQSLQLNTLLEVLRGYWRFPWSRNTALGRISINAHKG